MNTDHDNLNKLKGKNPFTVPKGYMEGLDERIMSRIPEKKPSEEARVVPLWEKVRPLIYLAAMFAGMMLFMKVLVGDPDKNKLGNSADSLLVKTDITDKSVPVSSSDSEDEEYLEYVEDIYAGYLLKEEIALSE